MKLCIQFFALIVLFFTVNAFANSKAAVELTQLLSHYKTYQANFKQQTFYNNNQKPELSYGRLYMERPGKFRWEVKKPMKQVVIANGNQLWVYDVELQQVTQQNLDKNKTNNPAVLLSGDVSKLIKQYEVTKVTVDGISWFQLKPRSSDSNFSLVRMHFKNQKLVEIWVKNKLDQVSLFQFFDIQLNVVLNSSLFNFKPPPGVDVLK